MTTTDYPFIIADDLQPGDVYGNGAYEILDVNLHHVDGVVAKVQFADGGRAYRSWERGTKAIGLTRPEEKA